MSPRRRAKRQNNGIHSLYIADGFVEDCEMFIQLCTVSREPLTFRKFTSIWKQLDFSSLYQGRTCGVEVAELSEEVIRIAKHYMITESSDFEENVAGVYLVYILLNLQPYEGFACLRLVPSDMEAIHRIVAKARRDGRLELLCILGKILIYGPVQYHVDNRPRGLEPALKKYFEGAYASIDRLAKRGQGVFSMQDPILDILHEMRALNQDYLDSKAKLVAWNSGVDPNLNYFNPRAVDELESSLKKIIHGVPLEESDGEEPKLNHHDTVQAIKKRAMTNDIGQICHRTGVNEKKNQRSISPSEKPDIRTKPGRIKSGSPKKPLATNSTRLPIHQNPTKRQKTRKRGSKVVESSSDSDINDEDAEILKKMANKKRKPWNTDDSDSEIDAYLVPKDMCLLDENIPGTSNGKTRPMRGSSVLNDDSMNPDKIDEVENLQPSTSKVTTTKDSSQNSAIKTAPLSTRKDSQNNKTLPNIISDSSSELSDEDLNLDMDEFIEKLKSKEAKKNRNRNGKRELDITYDSCPIIMKTTGDKIQIELVPPQNTIAQKLCGRPDLSCNKVTIPKKRGRPSKMARMVEISLLPNEPEKPDRVTNDQLRNFKTPISTPNTDKKRFRQSEVVNAKEPASTSKTLPKYRRIAPKPEKSDVTVKTSPPKVIPPPANLNLRRSPRVAEAAAKAAEAATKAEELQMPTRGVDTNIPDNDDEDIINLPRTPIKNRRPLSPNLVNVKDVDMIEQYLPIKGRTRRVVWNNQSPEVGENFRLTIEKPGVQMREGGNFITTVFNEVDIEPRKKKSPRLRKTSGFFMQGKEPVLAQEIVPPSYIDIPLKKRPITFPVDQTQHARDANISKDNSNLLKDILKDRAESSKESDTSIISPKKKCVQGAKVYKMSEYFPRIVNPLAYDAELDPIENMAQLSAPNRAPVTQSMNTSITIPFVPFLPTVNNPVRKLTLKDRPFLKKSPDKNLLAKEYFKPPKLKRKDKRYLKQPIRKNRLKKMGIVEIANNVDKTEESGI